MSKQIKSEIDGRFLGSQGAPASVHVRCTNIIAHGICFAIRDTLFARIQTFRHTDISYIFYSEGLQLFRS
jgi:hypothetical protein